MIRYVHPDTLEALYENWDTLFEPVVLSYRDSFFVENSGLDIENATPDSVSLNVPLNLN